MIQLCATAISMAAIAPVGWAQEDIEAKPAIIRASPAPGVIEIENDAVVEAGKNGELEIRSFKGPVGAPVGVDVVAPDEVDIVIDNRPKKPAPPVAPKAPKVEKKIRITKDDGTDVMARRLERLEQKLDALAERERTSRKNELVLNDKAMAKVQKEIDRASREADVAIRKFHFAHPGGEDEFAFEHKFHIAGSPKVQRKALEAQRKALEKQLEAIDKHLEKLDDEEEQEEVIKDDRGEGSKKDEEAGGSKGDVKPSLPPESAP